jgi:SAM-dependent methyltransferase
LLRPTAGDHVPSPPPPDADLEARIAYQIECLPQHYLPGIGIGDFIQEGEDLVRLLSSLGGLVTDDTVLDMGCGLGRVAIPLQRVLHRGSYSGFDIVPEIVHWNSVNISGVTASFAFHHLDVRNSTYNPDGRLEPGNASFPYADHSFSFAFATSLFSHLLADGTQRYLEELRRVLRPNGRAVLTFFLLNDEVESRAECGDTDIEFPQRWDHGRLNNPDRPEDAVAYDWPWLLGLIEGLGFEVHSLHWGRWSGHTDGLSYQDVLVLRSP